MGCRAVLDRPGLPQLSFGGDLNLHQLAYGTGVLDAVFRGTSAPLRVSRNALSSRRTAHPSARDRASPAAFRFPADRRSRVQRWRDAVAELTTVQAQCVAWLQALPTSLHESTTAEALQEICDLNLSELEAVEPPRGFGRD